MIRTTPEHPFYVQAKGWTPAGELEIGDLLAGHCVSRGGGHWTPVTDLLDTGEWETVYNFRIADYHTYFVGDDHWGFSVWAHNARYGTAKEQLIQDAIDDAGLSYGKLVKHPQHHAFPQNAKARAWFARRGVDVDDYAVNLYAAEHQALHGGGDWRLGMLWDGEWNNEIMRRLRDQELIKKISGGGNRLTPAEIERVGRDIMTDYGIGHLPFVRYEKGWF